LHQASFPELRKSTIILLTAQPFSIHRALINEHSLTVKGAIFTV